MRGVGDVFGVLPLLESDRIAVHQERCVSVRNRHASCSRCADNCASGCIAVRDGALTVDTSKCIGCGTCATVCPTCAIEVRDPSDAELLDRCTAAAHDRKVRIACERGGAAQTDAEAVAVPCVGRIDESLLTGLAARGVSCVRVECGACATCAYRSGRRAFDEVLSCENALLEPWGFPLAVEVREGVPLVGGSSFASDGGEDAVGASSASGSCAPARSTGEVPTNAHPAAAQPASAPAAAAARPKVMRDGTLPHFVPPRRKALLTALAGLSDEVPDASVDVRLWGHVAIDRAKCKACRMCAVFCPTGALSKYADANGRSGIVHCAADCARCGCCRDICPEGAITLEGTVNLRDVLGRAEERYPMPPSPLARTQQGNVLERMHDLIGVPNIA